MLKNDVVDYLALNTGLTKEQIRNVLSSLSKLTERELRENKKFTIPNLVRFTVFLRKGMPSRLMKDRRTWLNRMVQTKPGKPKHVVRATPHHLVKKMILPPQENQ
jgi:nucleoid DNA-binding protein